MKPLCRTLALPVIAAVSLMVVGMAASAQATIRCYGVALAGQNEGLDEREEPGSSSVDYQGNAWVMLPQDQCLRMALPVQTDGTPRRGAPEPLERDRPGT